MDAVGGVLADLGQGLLLGVAGCRGTSRLPSRRVVPRHTSRESSALFFLSAFWFSPQRSRAWVPVNNATALLEGAAQRCIPMDTAACLAPDFSSGKSSHVLSSSTLPASFLFVPPHCLKKKRTPALSHWSRMLRTHSTSIFLAPGPDSPPAITQSMPVRSIFVMAPIRGSKDRNRVCAGMRRRVSMPVGVV